MFCNTNETSDIDPTVCPTMSVNKCTHNFHGHVKLIVVKARSLGKSYISNVFRNNSIAKFQVTSCQEATLMNVCCVSHNNAWYALKHYELLRMCNLNM